MATRDADFSIHVFEKVYQRDSCDCGVDDLNRYLRTQARQDMDRGAAVVYVTVPFGQPTEIAGYYSLSSTATRLDDLPEPTRKKLPRYPLVPATLIGRLAVDQAFRGRRRGESLLIDALDRSLTASETVASAAVIVGAKDDTSAAFYARYGFISFPDQPLRLFIAMRAVEQLANQR